MNDTHPIPTVEITIATQAEAAVLAYIGRQTFFEAFAAQNDPTDMENYLQGAFSAEIQQQELSETGSVFWIARVDGIPAGYARVVPGDPDTPDRLPARKPLKLQRMYSLKAFYGKGVGGRLMQACLDHARQFGYDLVWLSVWQENPRAVAFYRKWGFTVAGSLTFTIGQDVQTDHLMIYRLE